MTHLKQFALVAAAASILAVAGGCASRYDDGYSGYYDNNGRYDRDRDEHWRDHHDRDAWHGDNDKRVRVCDADGSDCHWETRER